MIKNLKNKKKKGFTLIEIIAVIAIIAILAAILVPKVAGYMREAKKTAVLDEARKMVSAAESVQLKTGKSESDTGSWTATQLDSASGGLVNSGDLTKIGSATVEQCRQILDATNYTFTIDDSGNFSTVTTI